MRCIFCKQQSSSSRSREHIIPESLGNADHVLPRGVVCDSCNNYIARKVEKPILDSRYFQERRFQMGVGNKHERIPALDGFHLQSHTRIRLVRSPADGVSVGTHPSEHEEAEARWIRSLQAHRNGTLILPMGSPLDDYRLSRFIGKIGLEILAERVLDVPGGLDEIVDKRELDELRAHVRRGDIHRTWPVARRQLYAADRKFRDGPDVFEVLHEYQILATANGEYYVVVAIFGEEFVLNLGGPELSGYSKWVETNGGASPLYPKGLDASAGMLNS